VHAPNIVFIFSDDHAAHALSAYRRTCVRRAAAGHAEPRPAGSQGMLFVNAFVTNSICGRAAPPC
jgi:arylsulfatase A-like enzyme